MGTLPVQADLTIPNGSVLARLERRSPRILAALLLLGCLLRVWLAFFTSLPNLHRDSYEYFKQADAILAGSYVNFFPNGYPFLIAVVKSLAGTGAIKLLVWIHVLLSTGMIYFVYDITKRVFRSEGAALLAAAILAFFPSQINYTRWLITEMPTGFFLTGAYFFYYRAKSFYSGLFFGMAIIVRTEMLPVFFLIFVLEAFWKNSGATPGNPAIPWKKRINAWLLTGALLPILFTGGYCYVKTGHFSLAGNGQVNMALSITASGSYVDWSFPDHHPEINTGGKALRIYLDRLGKDPAGFLKSRWANLWELWGFYPSSAEGTRGMGTRLVIGLGNLFLVVFGLSGWWRLRREFSVFILLLPFLLVTFVHIFLFAMQRYTSPVEPFMIILAAGALIVPFRRLLRYRQLNR